MKYCKYAKGYLHAVVAKPHVILTMIVSFVRCIRAAILGCKDKTTQELCLSLFKRVDHRKLECISHLRTVMDELPFNVAKLVRNIEHVIREANKLVRPCESVLFLDGFLLPTNTHRRKCGDGEPSSEGGTGRTRFPNRTGSTWTENPKVKIKGKTVHLVGWRKESNQRAHCSTVDHCYFKPGAPIAPRGPNSFNSLLGVGRYLDANPEEAKYLAEKYLAENPVDEPE